MPPSSQLASRRALITGGASGFGFAIAQELLASGAHVAVGDILPDLLPEAAEKLSYEKLLPLELDVTSRASVQAAVAACETAFGGLDTFVHSAGVLRFGSLGDMTEEDWDLVLDVHLKGAFLCCQAVAPLLCKSGRGRIITIGSDASKRGMPMLLSYCTAKFGLIGLTKTLAGELAPYGVTVNCVCPGGVPTTGMGQYSLQWRMGHADMTAEEVRAAAAAEIPLGRVADIPDVVNAVMFFLREESDFLTGLALDVDGGFLSTVPVAGVGRTTDQRPAAK